MTKQEKVEKVRGYLRILSCAASLAETAIEFVDPPEVKEKAGEYLETMKLSIAAMQDHVSTDKPEDEAGAAAWKQKGDQLINQIETAGGEIEKILEACGADGDE